MPAGTQICDNFKEHNLFMYELVGSVCPRELESFDQHDASSSN